MSSTPNDMENRSLRSGGQEWQELWRLGQAQARVETQVSVTLDVVKQIQAELIGMKGNTEVSSREIDRLTDRLARIEQTAKPLTTEQQEELARMLPTLRTVTQIASNRNLQDTLSQDELKEIRLFLDERQYSQEGRTTFDRSLKITIISMVLSGGVFGVLVPLLQHLFIK